MQHDPESTICPVCTLYLRPGMTLKNHLTSHPKQKVIEALVRLAVVDEPKPLSTQSQVQTQDNVNYGVPQASTVTSLPQMVPYINQMSVDQHPSSLPGNHFFIYQQSMSASAQPPPQHPVNVSAMPPNPFSQQYLVPAVYNPQIMPYFYQQQQVIMSTNGMPPSVKPFDMSSMAQISNLAGRSTDSPSEVRAKDDKELEKMQVDKDHQQEQIEDLEEHESSSLPASGQSKPSNSSKGHLKIRQLDEESVNADCPDVIDAESVHDKMDEAQRPDSAFSIEPDNMPHSSDSMDQANEHKECFSNDSHALQVSNSSWSFSSDLNKACQTQSSSNQSPRSGQNNDAKSGYFYIDQRSNMSGMFSAAADEHHSYEQTQPIYTSANIINNTEGVDFVSMDDIEGMQVMIGDFSNSSLMPAVGEAYDSTPPVLLTVDGLPLVSSRQESEGKVEILEHKILTGQLEDNSGENVNIRSDEKMPARGELSGQESMGSTSDVTWNQLQHYQEPESVGSFEHNSWDGSEEMQPFAEETDKKVNLQTVDLEALKSEEPASTATDNRLGAPPTLLGMDVNKKKIKKLIIKPKKVQTVAQISFDNVFNTRLKQETGEPIVDDGILGVLDNKDAVKEELSRAAPFVSNGCKSCNVLFKTKRELRLHKSVFHKQQRKINVTKCQVCNEVFDMEHKFTEHLKIHPLECHTCGKLFYRRQGLKLHKARHLGIKPFKCELCDKAFLVKQKLEEHRNCHTGNAPLKCSMCAATFKRHSNLVQHRNKHHFLIKQKVKEYICYCGEVFHSNKKLAWHKEVHDSKPKACTQCNEKFIHMASLTRHMRRAHNAEYLPDNRNPASANTECPICKRVYLKTSLEAHLKIHTTQKQFSCSICSKQFSTKWNLKLHKWTHESRSQKPFKCELCKSAFIRENDYVSHMNSHKSLRPYTCNYCGTQFIRKSNCQRHVKEHENDKTYNCTICGKSFHRSYYLTDHMRVHSGDRPYTCEICGKTSTTKSNHNKHVQIHHARESVSTES